MQSCELVTAVSALACCIAKGRSAEELALLSSVFSQLGDTLDTISAGEDFCAAKEKALEGCCKNHR